MSAPIGIQYLHRDWFKASISAPVREYTNNTWGSLIPQTFYQLSKGIEKWHIMDENWLMIYLATEMCSLPSSRLGGPGLKPEEAYFVLLQDLVSWPFQNQEGHQQIRRVVLNLVDRKDEGELNGTTKRL